ncbi:MAG: S8 family serine peptidase [Anaerolineaceae bacterium]
MRSKTIRILALIIVLAMIASPVSGLRLNTVEAQGGLPGRSDLVPTGHTPVDKYSTVDAGDVVDKTEVSRYIVLFEGASLSRAKGSAGINSIEGQNYLDSLAVNRQAMLTKAESLLGRSIQVRYIYDVVLNGVSVELSAQEAEELQSLPGIRKVLKDQDYTYTTDAGPEWIGAGDIWDGTAVPDTLGTKGEGVLVGILDGGINFDHPSFSDTPDDGFVYSWTGDYLGVCAPAGDPEYADACNDKVVGAWSYTYDAPSDFVTPEDAEGHGSHTASTVAGNFVDVDFYGTEVTISGVAPHAQIIAYDVCYPTPSGGQCAGEDSIAAAQQAILDGVDVINYSISGGENPYSDGVELAFLDATAAGVTVSTSAGNSGPGAATVAHRSPWLLSTAASSHNRKFTSEVDFSNPLYENILTLAGEVPFTTDVVNSKVIYAGEDAGNELGCNAFPAEFFKDSIALIKRGTCAFSVKILNAEAAGAAGVLIFTNTNPPGPMSVSGTTIPGVMLDIPGTVGDALAAWVASTADETVSISAFGALHSDDYADIMADFSSRGPNTTFDVLKPDIAAPGLEILAAVADGVIDPDGETELDLYQGTSMSSPHDAGAAALLTALHPDWTPAEIKSALMLTAYDMLLKEDKTTAADPFDIGAGRIQLEMAGLTGLVMDESIDNYEAADPDQGGDVRTLNTASVYDSACVGECSWTRTFTSVADLPATYTVSAPTWITVAPASFTINPGASQEITITADVSAYEPGEWIFANIEFLTDDTHPGTVTELLAEDFEVWPPAGWTIDADPASCDTWLSTETTDYINNTGGTGFAADANSDYCGDAMDTWMISPVMDFSGFDSVSLQFKSDFWDYGNVDDGYVDVSVDGGTTWTNVLHYEKQDYYGPRTETVDLSAYVGETTVTLRFHYVAPGWDWYWQVDDVVVSAIAGTGEPISDVAIPAAVLPAAGNLPALAKFETHRDAGGDTLEDLVAVEITDLTVDKYGWAKGELNEIQLAQDPTNSLPYDNLSQVWYTVVPMDLGAARLVAEITASTAPDVDLFWGFDINGDGLPQEGEEYGSSATGTAFEYLSEWGFPVAFYDVWILVQNWQGSGAATDDITLSVGLVPYEPADPENMTVVGPTTNPAGEPFSLDILWHDIDTEAGDRLYGMIDVYADAAYVTPIGVSQLDVMRGVDDVIKTADVASAEPGDTITYTIEITNYTTDPIEYAINDVLPAGVTYVPGSVTGGAVYDAGTNAITWSGPVAASYRDYVVATSAEDPNCTLAIMADGDPTDDYLDWKTTSYGFSANAGISGDSFWYGTFSTYAPFNFYGVDYVGMDFTADGLTGWATAVSAANTSIPDATEPNNFMGLFWDDFIVQYDATNNYGVSLVGDGASFATIEYDDVQLKADTTKTLDMEVGYFLQPDDNPGAYEIVFAYDNITPGLFAAASGTIGVENVDGTVGTLVSYNDTALTIADGSAICFDWALLPAPPVVITFQVTVDEGSTDLLTNVAMHDNDQLGTVEEGAVAVVTLPASVKNIYIPLLFK